ncbi:MAG: helix-turn-helix domain-containing protein [Chitinophagaceae bacterium]
MTYYSTELNRIRQAHYSNKGQLDTVIGTRHFIVCNLDREVNLDLLARVRFTSKFHLLRLFKRFYGQTPKQYLIGQRIEKAKELLKLGMTVTDVCFEVGFDSPCSFSTVFKARTGKSPLTFKKEQVSQS